MYKVWADSIVTAAGYYIAQTPFNRIETQGKRDGDFAPGFLDDMEMIIPNIAKFHTRDIT